MRIKVKVKPRAGIEEISRNPRGEILIKLKAAPADGEANIALSKFLAKTLGVRQADIEIKSGVKSRDKILEIAGLSPEQMEKLIP